MNEVNSNQAISLKDIVYVVDGMLDSSFIVQGAKASGCTVVSMCDRLKPSLPSRVKRKLGRADERYQDFKVALGDGVAEDAKLFIVSEYDHGLAEALWLKRHRPGARVAMWWWNPISDRSRLDIALRAGIEAWTFDEADARRFGIFRNTQFWFDHSPRESTDASWDVYFVGRDKGRADDLAWIDQHLLSAGLRSNITIVPDRNRWKFWKESAWVPYQTVIDESARSVAVLDLVQDGQTGMTLRAVEALFLGVGLITNSQAVMDDPNYPKDHVFYLDGPVKDCDISELIKFVSNLERPVSNLEAGRRYFSFGSWLQRFNQ